MLYSGIQKWLEAGQGRMEKHAVAAYLGQSLIFACLLKKIYSNNTPQNLEPQYLISWIIWYQILWHIGNFNRPSGIFLILLGHRQFYPVHSRFIQQNFFDFCSDVMTPRTLFSSFQTLCILFAVICFCWISGFSSLYWRA